MDPKGWGKPLWQCLHLVALGYPKETPSYQEAKTYKEFYENFWKVLPCRNPCAVNYQRHLQELPIDNFLQNNMRLFEWTVQLHNIVNMELKKPQMTLEMAWNIYNDILVSRSEASNKNTPLQNEYLAYITILIFIIICLILYIVLKKR